MKDSGVEWIGEIPEKWFVLRNKNAFSCDKIIVGEDSETTQLLSLTTKGIKKKDINNAEGKLPESFDTYQRVAVDNIVMCLFDLDCSAVFSGISPYEGMISPAYRVLMCKDNIVPQYANYWFRYISDGRKFNHYAKNIRYTLSYEEFSALPILMPDVNTQKRIVDFLNAKCVKIDAVITRQQEAIEKLKAYKLSVITEAVTKGLHPDVPMKDSGNEWIGRMPQHWTVVKLGTIFDFLGGYAFNSDDYSDESENQIIRIGNVKNGRLILDTNPVFVNNLVAEMAEKFRIKEGTILFTMTGTKGKRDYFFTHLVRKQDIETRRLYLNQRVGCLIPTEMIYAGYYNYLLKDKRILDSIFIYETGTANQGNLGIESIRRTKLHFPPVEEQKAISNYLDQKCYGIDRLIDRKMMTIEKLLEYKKTLIYEVVTGKREV